MAPILIIDGDDNNNHLNGGSEAEVINGKGGDDFLSGGDGNDTLDGGAGKDILHGGFGANTYHWGRGGGEDIIVYNGAQDAGMNVLQLGEGVSASELRLTRNNDDLVLRIAGTEDSLTVHLFFAQQATYTGAMAWAYSISEIRFADGARWDMQAIQSTFLMDGRPLLVLDEQDNTMYGQLIDGAGGNDMLYGGGPSVLSGGSGNDTLIGSPGNDVLLGGSGDDSLVGGFGNDFLDGGAGNDVLNGEGGYDTYRFGHGSGQDTIAAPKYAQGDVLTIDMAPGVQAGTLTVLRTPPDSPDLVLELPLSGERLTIKDYFIVQRTVSIHFADGSVMNKSAIDMRAWGAMPVNTVSGTDGADFLNGSYGSDILRGGAGDDTLAGQNGDDLLIGGDGNDMLDVFQGNDVADGGAGNDRIMIGEGNATLLFGRASGHDELLPMLGGRGVTTVLLEAGIGAADIVLTRSNNGQGPELLINVGGAAASLRVGAYFPPTDMQGPAIALQFADGTRWDNALINNLLLTGNDDNNDLRGSAGNDRIDGRGGNDMLHGMQGNDLLLGGAGVDLLHGGEGDDTLNGGQGEDYLDDSLGNNTYVFARGDGRDMIFNNLKMPELRYQTIVFSAGIVPEEVQLQRVNRGSFDDLVLTINGAPGQEITVQGYIFNDPLYATNMQLKEIRFADGSKWDAAAIFERVNRGSEMGESMAGTDGNDVIDARGGDDILAGKGGDDTLIGGRGNDQLSGGDGSDTYVFNLGDGRDLLVDTREMSGVGNTLRFGAGITAADLRMTPAGSGLELAYGKLGDVIMFTSGGTPGTESPIKRIDFADGSVGYPSDYLNQAPQLKLPLPDQAATPGQHFKLSLPAGMFIDPNAGDVLSLMMAQSDGLPLPAWLRFDAASGLLEGTVPQGVQGNIALRVTAKDQAGLHVTDDFILAVGAGNSAPTVALALKPITTYENSGFSVRTPTFADADIGDSLSVKLRMADGSALPSWLWFDGKETLRAVTDYDRAGNYQLVATATDQGGLTVSSNIDIVVKNANRAPVPTEAPGTLNAARDTPFSFVLPARTLVDPDGDAVTYRLTQSGGAALPSWLSFDPLTRTLSGTPLAGDAPSLSLALGGTDSFGLNGAIGFKLNIAADAARNLDGKADADVLNGASAGDTLSGMAGNDQLNGFAGNDTLDGGLGADRMAGGIGDDRYLVDAAGDLVVELANEGRDTLVAALSYTLPVNAEVLVLGGAGSFAGYGNGADNVLYGNSGNNFLNGYGGNDLLQGGAGNDSLVDTMGKNLFDGGSGVDTLSGGASNEMYIGGAGNDIITTGSGVDIIAFNRGDGSDTVTPGSVADNVISLGRGITYADLTFKKAGSDLVFGTGAGEQISLKGWFATSGSHSVGKLQMFIDGSSDFLAASPLAMHSQKVQLFNFDALAGKFELAMQANPALASWNLAPELAGAWIKASGNMAIGGDLAQQYATAATLANVAQVPALNIIGSSSFGDGQYLTSPINLADGSGFLI
ncbi:putative Ig domain-containing protein [Massilia violaceinigra]|uniref:Ig domain-containing protein n=1 Tax=Massilia violaceinigra TaxID=2045208 RepID=A0ABY4A0P4_9BURK|nr:putative Ig domain-containing protein [Massilia violaceinigra]UOD27284.1 putative Ig domain-containing protein [Massilia violaceinigra]